MSDPVLQAEIRVSDGDWQLFLRRKPSESFRLTASGPLTVKAQADGSITVPLEVNTLRLEDGQVTLDGKPLKLTPTEYTILSTMMAHPKRVFSGYELLPAGQPARHLSPLRKKLGARFIFNHPGRGWSLVAA